MRPPEKQDGTPIRELSLIAFPIRELFEVKLDEFDLIIFDRYRQRGVLPRYYYENIAAYVKKGGALLESTGPSYASSFSLYRTPLGEALPAEPLGRVIEGGFKPRVTDIGQRHPVTADLPGSAGKEPQWGRWFRLVDAGVTRGLTVMSGTEGRPLLVLDRYGDGRVAQILSDQVWLWSRGFEGGGPQAELLRRLAHWLMKEPDLEEEDLRAAVHDGKLEITRRSLSEQTPEVQVTTPSGTKRTLRLEQAGGGRWTGVIPADEIGLYRVDNDPLTAFAASGALNPIELADEILGRAFDWRLLRRVWAGDLRQGLDRHCRQSRLSRDWNRSGPAAARILGLGPAARIGAGRLVSRRALSRAGTSASRQASLHAGPYVMLQWLASPRAGGRERQ